MKNLKKTLPYGTHFIDNSDILAVTKVLKSRNITQGPQILKTEKKLAKYVGSKYAVIVSSCSAGLHIACKALGMNNKSTMLTTPITFVSSANSALHCGAKIVLSDIDLNNLNLSLHELEKIIKKKKINFLMPVHFSGLAFDTKKIFNIARKKNIKIIEDGAHALGSRYFSGERVGSCKYSDVTVFSFHPVKTITGAEGGAITTNSKEIYMKLLEYRSHGITKNLKQPFMNKKEGYSKGKKNLWFYEMKELGYHYRSNDILCSLIESQLKKINKFINYRKNLAQHYDKLFKNNDLISTYNSKYRKFSSNHLYVININFEKLKINRNEVMLKLKNRGIITQVHYIPLHFQPYFIKKNISLRKNSNAEKYYRNCLSIPLYYGLKKKEQIYVYKEILKIINSNRL